MSVMSVISVMRVMSVIFSGESVEEKRRVNHASLSTTGAQEVVSQVWCFWKLGLFWAHTISKNIISYEFTLSALIQYLRVVVICDVSVGVMSRQYVTPSPRGKLLLQPTNKGTSRGQILGDIGSAPIGPTNSFGV